MTVFHSFSLSTLLRERERERERGEIERGEDREEGERE
jgi:hypothetical protein